MIALKIPLNDSVTINNNPLNKKKKKMEIIKLSRENNLISKRVDS